MFSFRRCVLGIGLALCTCAIAVATPPVTTIQDVLFNADGTPYQGTATISWPSFEAVDDSMVAAQTITVQVIDGFIRVQLVPTTNAVTPASYSVAYNSGGNAQYTESWLVPPSDVPVRIRDVRVGGPGTVVGGGVAPAPLNSIQLSDVIGLAAALSVRPTVGPDYTASRAAVINSSGSVDGASGVLTDCLHVDGSSAPCGGTGGSGTGVTGFFVDSEVPSGTINGTNTAFTLSNIPNPQSSLALFRNGLMLKPGLDYTLSSAAITFLSVDIPVVGDTLQASYRSSVTISGVGFLDGETPAGSVNGVNTAFVLSQIPSPAGSLTVYRNGLRLMLNQDFTISAANLVFSLAPQTGDTVVCSYRVVTQ